MNNKFLIAGLIGSVASFLLGYLIYGVLIGPMMSADMMAGVEKPMGEFNWAFLVLGNIGFGFLYAYVLTKSNTAGFAGGAGMGAVIGFLFALGADSIMYATTNVTSLKGVCLDIVASVVMGALVGGIIGAYLGSGKPAATAV
jgi:hypothetical protein